MSTVRYSTPLRQTGALSGAGIAAIVALVVVLLAAAFFLLRGAPEPERIPGVAGTPATTAEERGDSARDIIADLQSKPGAADLAQAYGKARAFRQSGQLADTQLLLFYAARGGHGPAAFDLATLYDPNHFSAGASVLSEPDAFQAYKWYRQALDAGEMPAQARLDALRAWAERAARNGDQEADRLLLQWK